MRAPDRRHARIEPFVIVAQDVEYLGQRVRVVAAVEQDLRAAVVGLLLEVAAEAEHGCLQPDRDHAAPAR